MTAIQLGPRDNHQLHLYDLPEPKLRLTPRTIGAITAVAALYGGLGMMLNLAGIDITIPQNVDPPAIVITRWVPPTQDITIEPPPPPPPPTTLAVREPMTPIPAPVEPIFAPSEPVSIEPATTHPTTLDPGPTAPAAEPAPVPATPASKPSPVISNPSWLAKPSAAQLGRLYPERAARNGVSGSTVMECRVTAQGTVASCTVVQESPKGYGFGDAALASTRYFRLNPRMVDGSTVEGAKVRIPMAFTLSE
jgi:protein TonB